MQIIPENVNKWEIVVQFCFSEGLFSLELNLGLRLLDTSGHFPQTLTRIQGGQHVTVGPQYRFRFCPNLYFLVTCLVLIFVHNFILSISDFQIPLTKASVILWQSLILMNNSISLITVHAVINKTAQIAVHFWNAECSLGIIQMSFKQDKICCATFHILHIPLCLQQVVFSVFLFNTFCKHSYMRRGEMSNSFQ